MSPVRRVRAALAFVVCERRAGAECNPVDARRAAKPNDGEQCALGALGQREASDFSGCLSRGILQKLANHPLGQNLERLSRAVAMGSLAGSNNAYMLKESRQP